jgi:putative tryptophan/tyrosine transport system substrate-binding protein
MRRIGVLMNLAADDPAGQVRFAAFVQGLQQLGGLTAARCRSTRVGQRAIPTIFANTRRNWWRSDLTVILAAATPAVTPLQQVTRTVPIVFIGVIDPVGSGLVASLARPGGNATGFVTFEYALAAKWLELLKEIAPRVTRAAVLRDPTIAAGIG